MSVIFGFMISGGALAHGSTGGTCPSGANYLNQSGQMVTLANMGITSCFYVSKANGSDSNSGTSESSPWQHLPGTETTCTGNCASANPGPGQGYILRGGDTWPNSDLGIYWHPSWSGNATNPIYIGVDQSWYNSSVCGSGWCRPIFNCQGQICADVGNTGNMFFLAQWGSHVVVDNIEMTGLHTTTGQAFAYVKDYGSNNVYQQLYLHGWSHSSTSNGDWDNAYVYSSNSGSNSCLHDSIIDGSDTTQDMLVALFAVVPCAYRNWIGYTTNGMEAVGWNIHDNTFGPIMTPFSGITHQNHLFHFGPDAGQTAEFIYNNFIFVTNLGSASGGAVSLWLNGNEGSNATAYSFNNLIYDVGPGNILNTSGHNSIEYGGYVIFNNTFECGTDSNPGGCDSGNAASGPMGTYASANNHYINNNGSTPVYCYTTYNPCTITTNLIQSISTANGQGYSSGSLYPFSPQNANGGTVGAGTNQTSVCNTIAGLNAAAGAACQNDTTLGVAENTANHTVSSTRTPNPRPGSGAWDAGAYEFSAADPPPNPPTGLTAVVN
ncbi:MAG TPA: hypothetical protein VF753_17760 [Terriglobales bacterium]